MSNPAVMLLASLKEISGFPYRFEIEDNVGEAIHIHYKDIRLDMTIEEFHRLADSLRDIFTDLVGNEKFHIEDFDAGNLVWLAQPLIDLEDIVEEEVYLEDILVDTYDKDGKVVYRPLPESRVLKALHGDTAENDARKQINYFVVNGCERETNQGRIGYNMEQIKKEGYPRNNELILLRSDNTIIDGQHRASCLYYLYGNIKVPVRKIYFKERMKDENNTKQDMVFYYQELNQMLRQKHFELEQQYHKLDIVLNEKDRIIANYQEEQQKRDQDIHKLDIALNEKDRIIASYQEEQQRREQDVQHLDETLNEKDRIIANYQGEIALKNGEIAKKENEITQKENEIVRKESERAQLESEVYKLGARIDEMENSLSWRMTKPLRKISGSDK